MMAARGFSPVAPLRESPMRQERGGPTVHGMINREIPLVLSAHCAKGVVPLILSARW